MDIFIIVIVAIIVLFLVFLVLNIMHSSNQTPKTENKVENKKTVEETKTSTSAKEIKLSTQLTSRPDFSDLIPEKKETLTPQKNKNNYEEINGGRLKVIKESEGLKKETDLYKKKSSNNKNLAKEIKELSPEMKTVMFGKVLDTID